MKITASKRDDLLKQKADYDSKIAELDSKIKEGEDKYHQRQWELKQGLEKEVSDIIGPTSLDLQITANPYGSFTNMGWSIRVNANEHSKFAQNVALAWNWEVSITESGEIVKDSGSWSGLKVITSEQIADLEESVRVIKILNGIGWEDILSSENPEYYDYVDKSITEEQRVLKNNRPDIKNQLIDARLEELVNQNIAIQLSSDQYYNGKVGILLTGLTDKFIKGYIFPWSMAEQGSAAEAVKSYVYNEERRTAKDKIVSDSEGNLVEVELA